MMIFIKIYDFYFCFKKNSPSDTLLPCALYLRARFFVDDDLKRHGFLSFNLANFIT